MTEEETVSVALGEAFGLHLATQGWEVLHREDAGFLIAVHGSETLMAELYDDEGQPGEDMDRLYGRLLRRLPDYPDAHLVGVVPERLRWHVNRVPDSVRQGLLHLDIYLVDALGAVHRLQSESGEKVADERVLARVLAVVDSPGAPEVRHLPRPRRGGGPE